MDNTTAGGRTSWWPCDSAEHDRELNVELGEEFGPGGPYLMRVLKDLAQAQRDDGRVKTGFRVMRTKTHVQDVETVRAIIEHAAQIGALDDLQVDDDGRRFSCRLSGWKADQARGRAAVRQAAKRDREPDPEPEPVALAPVRDERTGEHVQQIFQAWVKATDRDPARTQLTADRRRRIVQALKTHGFEDCIKAVGNIGADAWARGANDRGRRFDDIEHALGSAKRIEDWRDRTPRRPGAPTAVGHDLTRQRRAGALRSLQTPDGVA